MSATKTKKITSSVDNACGANAVFALALKAHMNTQKGGISTTEIDFQPVEEIARACSKIFESVDREDDFQRRIAHDAWYLKSTAMLTVLPFDDERLNLEGLVRKLEQAISDVPEISGPVNALRRSVDMLLRDPANPKRKQVLDQLKTVNTLEDPIGLVANLNGSSTPGWPADIHYVRDFDNLDATIIRTKKGIRDKFFSKIIIPGNPKLVPRKLLFELLYSGKSSKVLVICYRAERLWIPPLPQIPVDSLFSESHPRSTNIEAINTIEVPSDSDVEQWVKDSFWNSIRAKYENATVNSDRDVNIRARFVLFADGSGAFLPEDGRVVEIADKFDLGHEFDKGTDRLPRKAVTDLEEGDLVMMRLTGSGDYLDEVADSLIQQAGEGHLRNRALEWKDLLIRILKRHGEGVVASKLRDLNVSLRSANYLWSWAGDAVMAPHDKATFMNLIRGMHELDPIVSEFNVEEYALAKWNDMELVKTYQLKAGVVIRSELVTRVRELIAKRQKIDTVQTIELLGVKAGKMGLLRVSDVDGKVMRVPLSRMFHLSKVAS